MSTAADRSALFLKALFVLWRFAICAAVATAQNSALVSQMARNEAASRAEDTHYSYYAEETSPRTGGHLWRERVIETDDGPLHRLLAIDGKPLTQVQAQTEEERIRELVRDPSALKSENHAQIRDEAHAASLLGLLPKAFILKPAGEENGCTRFSFRPNPEFVPSDYEERVAQSMEGTVSLRQPINRLCLLQATIFQPVEFGFGFLGRIESGGHFTLGRVPVDAMHWKSNYISVHIKGRILMLKSLTRDQQVRRTEIQIVPQHLSLQQAVEMSSR